MNVVATCLLWFCLVISLKGGDAVSCTNGFPTTLVYSITFPTGSSTRLIPEMNFTCSGTIMGYTAALRERDGGNQGLKIQIWRKSTSQPGSFYNTSAGIAINRDLCVGGLTNVASGVFHCNLNQTTTSVAVQAGDILGLELPVVTEDDQSLLAFANVSRGPTNCILMTQALSSPTSLSSCDSLNWKLPQISLEIGSGHNCNRGFSDLPVSEVRHHTTTNIITLLIPEMNFTCNASIVGFTVAGAQLSNSQVQIWNRSDSHSSDVYYLVGDVSLHVQTPRGGVCEAARRIADNTYWCILGDDFKVPVQPGYIFGLELPVYNAELLFTSGGPVNYIFEHHDSIVNLSHNGSYTTVKQLPQIMLNFTSDHCLNGFPSSIIAVAGRRRGDQNRVTTRLFPDLTFGCSGTIVKVTVIVRNVDGNQTPKIQIWRKSETQPGLYYKTSFDTQIKLSNPPCYQRSWRSSNPRNRILRCILREDLRISVQPGDFLGLEIPPYSDDDLEVFFKANTEGTTNLVFQRRLGSTVDLFIEPHSITNDEPQINFLVVLDDHTVESTDSYPDDMSTITPLPTETITHVDIVQTSTIAVMANTGCTTIAGVLGGIIAILLLMVIFLLVAVFVQRRDRKQYTVAIKQRKWKLTRDCNNPNYNGSPNFRPVYVADGESCPNPAYGVSDIASTSPNPAYGVSSRDIPTATIFNNQAPEYDDITAVHK